MKVSELTGIALNYAVSQCEGVDHDTAILNIVRGDDNGRFLDYTDWAQGGPIIERERLFLEPMPGHEGTDGAWFCVAMTPHEGTGHTALIAAMRCFVASKLGDEVEIPAELI